MRQALQGAVGLCDIIVLHFILLFRLWVWHWKLHLLNSLIIFSLSYMLLISQSQVNFPCRIIVVEVWNSTYLVLILKCEFISKMFCSSFFETYKSIHSGGKSMWYWIMRKNIYCSCIIQFSQCDISINVSSLNNFSYGIWGAYSGEDS